MGHTSSHGTTSSEAPHRRCAPGPWWSGEEPQIPLEALFTGEALLPSEIDEAHRVIRLLAGLCLEYRERLEQELKHRYGRRSEKLGGEKEKDSEPKPADGGKTTA